MGSAVVVGGRGRGKKRTKEMGDGRLETGDEAGDVLFGVGDETKTETEADEGGTEFSAWAPVSVSHTRSSSLARLVS